MTCIAIIDDDQTLLELTRELFAEQGWDSRVFPEPTGAVAALAASPPDLILLDFWFERPGSGWELLLDLKLEPRTRAIPVIVWSGASDRLREREAWLHEHGVPTLRKPFELEELYHLIERQLAPGTPTDTSEAAG